jgi:hypothetical protein
MTRIYGCKPWIPLSVLFKLKRKNHHILSIMHHLIREINSYGCPPPNFECFVTSDWQCDSGAPSERLRPD